MYPSRYQLQELTAHLVSLLERRRGAFEKWSPDVEKVLQDEAVSALHDAGKQFLEIADDAAYWKRIEHTLLTVAVPRYLRLANDEHERESKNYGIWRGGDLVSRVVYAGVGLLAAAIVWRTPIPDYLELFPLTFFIVGPLFPDLQLSMGKRRYSKQLKQLIDDMAAEQVEWRQYQPLGIDDGAAGSAGNSTHADSRDKTGA